ncbi:MAG: hypothetical protein IRZ08_17575, partial [Frankia sp.]|nr:hypothetical protein [Frankia sp.]
MTALATGGVGVREPVARPRPAGQRPGWAWLPRALLVVLLVAAAVGFVLGRPEGTPRRAVALEDGAAWLVSAEVGQAALVDGASGRVLARIEIGGPDPVGVQRGNDAFLSLADGTVLRVDGATYRMSEPATPFSQDAERLDLHPAPDALFAVSPARRLVIVADPQSLDVRRYFPVTVDIRAGGVIADDADR